MKNPKTLNNEKHALIVCDMLNDFVLKGAPLEVARAQAIIGNIKREIIKSRKKHIPIIYCCDGHRPADPEFSLWPRHAVKGTVGAQVIDELKPHKGDYLITKPSYSCFYKTALDKLLKQLGITHVILTGVATNICILYTVAEASMRGYKVIVPENCVAALSQGDHRFALQQMKRVFQVEIV
ncbi:MAG: entB [Candidatus Brocadiaceae bacterium]|nr:entB [Candidatus Brocadiaceae bacterium]